ncbi:AbrB/MazE/SpoVT family DNA-binding domain-containing protein [Halomicrococcus sp. SG-WS-1]|uniref:AbrB/MazE/SpoVT family DNA-binding domain-containing protein n=1 Tax=Halomicrococcus sp. SG-WS-1 TaxID=3439057 RepID=UPI003F79D101
MDRTLETRKVQFTGNSTYTISLPKEWADHHGVEAGMQLPLYPSDNGELVIGADRAGDDERPEVDVTGMSAADVRQTVEALYAAGNEQFALGSDDGIEREHRRVAETVAADRTGLQLQRETEAELLFGTILDTESVSIERTVLQLQYTTLSMHRNAVRALLDGNVTVAGSAAGRWDDVVRRLDVASSCFHRSLTDVESLDSLGYSRPAMFDRYAVSRHLASVAEQAKRTAEAVNEQGRVERTPWAAELDGHAEQSRDYVDRAVDAALTADHPPHELVQSSRSLAEDVSDLRRRAYREDDVTYAWATAMDGVERTATTAAAVAEQAVQAALRDDVDESVALE